MGTIDTINQRKAARPPGRRIAKGLLHALGWIDLVLERRRSRKALLELDDHLLKDVGISRPDAYRESRRPFWD